MQVYLLEAVLVNWRTLFDRLDGPFLSVNLQQLQKGFWEHDLVAGCPEDVYLAAQGLSVFFNKVAYFKAGSELGLKLVDGLEPVGSLRHEFGQVVETDIPEGAKSLDGEFTWWVEGYMGGKVRAESAKLSRRYLSLISIFLMFLM